MRVSPEPATVELLKTYRTALNHAIERILDLNLRSLKDIHRALYIELKERFNPP